MVQFKKGEPTYVPPAARRYVMEVGATPVDTGEDHSQEDPTSSLPQEPSGEDREKAVFKVFEALVARDKRGDFDAAGKPTPKVISQLVGFEIDAKERNALWQAFLRKDDEG